MEPEGIPYIPEEIQYLPDEIQQDLGFAHKSLLDAVNYIAEAIACVESLKDHTSHVMAGLNHVMVQMRGFGVGIDFLDSKITVEFVSGLLNGASNHYQSMEENLSRANQYSTQAHRFLNTDYNQVDHDMQNTLRNPNLLVQQSLTYLHMATANLINTRSGMTYAIDGMQQLAMRTGLHEANLSQEIKHASQQLKNTTTDLDVMKLRINSARDRFQQAAPHLRGHRDRD